MKKGAIIGLVVLGVLLILVFVVIGNYNNMTTSRENVDTKSSDVDVYLQRRADLIPNLVSTVKGYMQHEEQVISDITTARENLLNASSMSEKATANDELTSAINALAVVVENYPDLKANTNFINLQDELTGAENRISTARRDYNDAVKEYNTLIIKFHNNILASMFNFEKAEYFKADEGKTDAPNVEF
jgi:LemA protein